MMTDDPALVPGSRGYCYCNVRGFLPASTQIPAMRVSRIFCLKSEDFFSYIDHSHLIKFASKFKRV